MTPQLQSLRREHDYVIEELSIVVLPRPGLSEKKIIDFRPQLLELSYEENIFTGMIVGQLVVKDTVDFPTLLPFIGEERIRIILTRQDETSKNNPTLLDPIEFEGLIYTMQGGREIQNASRKLQSYTLKFISDGFVNHSRTRVRRSFFQVPYSIMVRTVYEQYLKHNDKPLIVEETLGLHDYIISNRRPITAINQIAKRSRCPNCPETSTYVFYEDRDAYYFVTLNWLFKQDPIKKIKAGTRNRLTAEGVRDIAEDINTTTQYNQSGTYDVLNDLRKGKSSSRMYKLDPIRRKLTIQDFDIEKEWNKFDHISDNKPYTENNAALGAPESTVHFIISDEGHDEILTDSRPFALESTIQTRSSQLQQMKRNAMTISLPGDPRIKAGATIEFYVPESLGKMNKDNPEEEDKYISGKYLIVSCAHILKDANYTTNLELIKDSFLSPIQYRDPEETYKNIY